MLIASCHGATYNVQPLWYTGLLVTIAGMAGWAWTLIPER